MTGPYGLTPQTVARMRAVFARHANVDEATLYGSRAIGTFRPGSDIDVTLMGQKLQLRQLLKIATELDALMLPYKFDLSLFHQLDNSQLIDHIRRVGIAIYMSQARG